jgi:hypothetical protein
MTLKAAIGMVDAVQLDVGILQPVHQEPYLLSAGDIGLLHEDASSGLVTIGQ